MDGERTLLLLRHAQAGGQPGVGDEQRPLTNRGLSDAGSLGRWLLAEGLLPDRVLCSTALRTRQTWQRVSAALGAAAGQAQVSFERQVYEAGGQRLAGLACECPDEAGTLLLVGHNPAMHELATSLVGRLDLGFPAGGLAVLRVRGCWRDLSEDTAELATFWHPPVPA